MIVQHLNLIVVFQHSSFLVKHKNDQLSINETCFFASLYPCNACLLYNARQNLALYNKQVDYHDDKNEDVNF